MSKSTLCGVLLPPFCFKKFQAREKLKEQNSEHQYTFHVLDSIIVNTLPNLLSFSLATCTHLFFFKHLKVNCRHDATPAFNLKNKDSILHNYNTIMTFKKCNIDTIASKIYYIFKFLQPSHCPFVSVLFLLFLLLLFVIWIQLKVMHCIQLSCVLVCFNPEQFPHLFSWGIGGGVTCH